MRTFAAGLTVAAALSSPAVVLAARAPTTIERAAITAAVRRLNPDAPRVCYPLRVRISTRNPRYASADFRVSMRCGVVVGNGTYLLRRVAPKRWRVIAKGSSYDCGNGPAPPAVMRDLLSYCRT